MLTKAHEKREANTHTMGLTRIPVVFLRAAQVSAIQGRGPWGTASTYQTNCGVTCATAAACHSRAFGKSSEALRADFSQHQEHSSHLQQPQTLQLIGQI